VAEVQQYRQVNSRDRGYRPVIKMCLWSGSPAPDSSPSSTLFRPTAAPPIIIHVTAAGLDMGMPNWQLRQSGFDQTQTRAVPLASMKARDQSIDHARMRLDADRRSGRHVGANTDRVLR
jgi:hypothetical protein